LGQSIATTTKERNERHSDLIKKQARSGISNSQNSWPDRATKWRMLIEDLDRIVVINLG